MRSVVLILCLTYASISALSAPRPRHETISGRVVAYSYWLGCLNGNGYWSMVIRVRQSKNILSEFIRVDFSLPCDTSPESVSAKLSIQKFRLFRQKDCDAVLEGSTVETPKQEPAMQLESTDGAIKQVPNILFWKYLPGTEHVALPFGQVLPCYRSIDLPMAPAL
jgi:hypothetical protein